jgi:hypothetical protein
MLEKCLYYPQDGLYIPLELFQTKNIFFERTDINQILKIHDSNENILLLLEKMNSELCLNHLISFKEDDVNIKEFKKNFYIIDNPDLLCKTRGINLRPKTRGIKIPFHLVPPSMWLKWFRSYVQCK